MKNTYSLKKEKEIKEKHFKFSSKYTFSHSILYKSNVKLNRSVNRI